eukprot:scaffold8093_cov118-Isochrysis_galbana.AAC.2
MPAHSNPSGRIVRVGSRPRMLSTSRKFNPADMISNSTPNAGSGSVNSAWGRRATPATVPACSTKASSEPAMYRRSAIAAVRTRLPQSTRNGKRKRTKQTAMADFLLSTAPLDPKISCARIAWAIVPLYPKELTHPQQVVVSFPTARCSVDGCVGSTILELSASITCGFRTRRCALGGVVNSRKPASITTSPAVPAAGSPCPATALTLLISKARPWVTEAPIVAANERTSIGSPNGVPVP